MLISDCNDLVSTSSVHASVPPFSYGAPPQPANMPPAARVPSFPKY